MKRLVSVLSLVAFLGISGLFASVDSVKIESQSVQKLSQADSNFLFGKNADELNLQILSKQELQETKGEFWPAIGIAFGIAAGSYGLCAIFNKGCRFDFNYGQRF